MDCKITSTKREQTLTGHKRSVLGLAGRRIQGFTLPEVLIASGLGVIAVVVVSAVSMFSGRSFVAIANYVELDQQSQLALDKMSREIRQARLLTSFSPTSLTLMDQANNPLQFTYQPDTR